MSVSVECILCDSHYARVVITKNSWRLVRCEGCGLVSTALDHPISRSELEASYDREYFMGKVYKDYFQERHVRRRLFERKFELIKKYLPETGRLLDVGAAAGFFLEVARRHGFEVHGVEISEAAATYAIQTLNLDVFVGELGEAKFPDESFDVITMWDVLEHLSRPVASLEIANRLLKQSGVLIIETINTSCVNARIMGKRWPLYWPPLHLFYFSLETLRILLSKSGFNVIDIVPMQTYSPFHSHRAVRYFDKPHMPTKLLLRFFGDVVMAVCRK